MWAMKILFWRLDNHLSQQNIHPSQPWLHLNLDQLDITTHSTCHGLDILLILLRTGGITRSLMGEETQPPAPSPRILHFWTLAPAGGLLASLTVWQHTNRLTNIQNCDDRLTDVGDTHGWMDKLKRIYVHETRFIFNCVKTNCFCFCTKLP